ncbi:hypothetical protein SHIRM173S_09825 [Streptomyces hirsutus]
MRTEGSPPTLPMTAAKSSTGPPPRWPSADAICFRCRHGDSLGPARGGHDRLRGAAVPEARARRDHAGTGRPSRRGGPGRLRLRPRGGTGRPHARPRPGPGGRPGSGAAHPGLPRGTAVLLAGRRDERAALAAGAGLRGRRLAGARRSARRGRRGSWRAVAAGVACGGAQGRGGAAVHAEFLVQQAWRTATPGTDEFRIIMEEAKAACGQAALLAPGDPVPYIVESRWPAGWPTSGRTSSRSG